MHLNVTLTMVLSSALLISGCSLSLRPTQEMQTINNQQTEIEQLKVEQKKLQAQLQAMQPELQRLIEMEYELKSLIEQQQLLEETKKKTRQENIKSLEARPSFIL